MSVTGASTRNDYISNTNQTVFAYTFQILIASDLKVLKNGVELSLNNDYSVSNAGESGGGSFTLSTGANAGDKISALLAMPIDRSIEYQNAGDFLASDINGDLNKAYIALNQLQTDIARAIKLADPDQTVALDLPLAADRAGKFLRFDVDGSVNVTTGTPSAPTTTDEVTYDPNEAGSVQRSLTSRLKDYVSVKDFGAVGDGVTDDRLAIQAAIDYSESQAINPQGTPPVYFPSGIYRIGSTGDTYGLRIKKANVEGSGVVGCILLWGGDPEGTLIQYEAKYRKSLSGFRFRSANKGVNDPKWWIDATWKSNSSIKSKLDWGDFFSFLFFEQTANVADAAHMNLPKIINFYCRNMRFQAAPHLVRIAQTFLASANRVFAMEDWTTDFNQLPAGGVKSLFQVDMQGAASLTLALSNARMETRHNAMGSPKAVVEVVNTMSDEFTPGSQTFTNTAIGRIAYQLTAGDSGLISAGDQLIVTINGEQLKRKLFSFDSDTATVTLATAPSAGSTVLIAWAPFAMPVNGISLDLRDIGMQLTQDLSPTDDSQVSQEAVLVSHTTNQTNVTSDIQMQNVFLDGFSSIYGGNWSDNHSTPNPSDLTGSVRLKFWSTGRMPEKMSQQLGDWVKFGDAVQFHREAANSLSMAGVGNDVAMTLDVHGDFNVSNSAGLTKAGFTGSDGSLRVGNSAGATTLGSVAKKIEVFNQNGVSLGFVPVYSTIT